MYQNYVGNYYGSHGSSSSSASTNTHSSTDSIMSRMNETSALALLQHLDKDELQHLLDNDSKLQDLIEDLPQVKSLQVDHDNLVATNKSLAEYNLSLQPRIEDLKHHVASEYEKVNSVKTDLAKDKAQLDNFVGRRSLDTMLALLQTETAKSEEESEQLADTFYAGGMDETQFLSEYLPKRTLTHLRRIKCERFAELIRDSHTGSASSSSNHNSWGSPSHSSRPPYPGDSVSAPYPSSSGFGMPLPYFPR